MRYTLTTSRGVSTVEAGSYPEAARLAVESGAPGPVLGLQKGRGKAKCYLVRGGVPYPISAGAAAVEAAMVGGA